MVFPPGHCPVALPLLPTSGDGLPPPVWSDCSCRWSCHPPAVRQPWRHGPTSQSPDTSGGPLPRNSQEPYGDRKPFTLSKNPGLKMQWPQPLLLCQISGRENNCEQFNSLDLASLALPVKVSNAHRAPHLHTQPAFLLGRRHAGIAEKLGSPGPAAQKGLGGRTRNLLANSRTDFLCESRRQGLHPGQAAPAPRTVLG